MLQPEYAHHMHTQFRRSAWWCIPAAWFRVIVCPHIRWTQLTRIHKWARRTLSKKVIITSYSNEIGLDSIVLAGLFSTKMIKLSFFPPLENNLSSMQTWRKPNQLRTRPQARRLVSGILCSLKMEKELWEMWMMWKIRNCPVWVKSCYWLLLPHSFTFV